MLVNTEGASEVISKNRPDRGVSNKRQIKLRWQLIGHHLARLEPAMEIAEVNQLLSLKDWSGTDRIEVVQFA